MNFFTPRHGRILHVGAGVLALAGGAVALAHQVLWTRRMVDLLGASAGSVARVFGCFFLGLALGAIIGALLAGRTRRPWWWVGTAELGIAVLCLPMVFLPWWADGIWPWLGPERIAGWEGAFTKTVLSFLLVLPPAALMGFFLPLAVVGLPRAKGHADSGLWLYALNTLGAVAGIVFVTVWMLPALGLMGAMAWPVAVNAMAGLGAFALHGLWRSGGGEVAARRDAEAVRWREGLPPPRFLAAAALSGMLLLAVEVIALPMIQLAAPMSFFTPAAVLGCFILLLAVAAFAVAFWIRRRGMPPMSAMRTVPLLAAVAMACAPLAFHPLAAALPVAAEAGGLGWFFLRLTLFALILFGPAVLLGGLWFPLTAALSGAAAKDGGGLRWGWLLAANGAGGLIGAEIAYGALLPLLGPFAGIGLVALAYAVAAWAFPGGEASPLQEWSVRGSLAVALVLFVWVHPRLAAVHPSFVPALLAQHHGREGSLAVLEDERMGRAVLVQNQYFLGSSAATPRQEFQAHLPLLLHPRPERAAFIGIATGITPGGALAHSAVGEIHAVEISRPVARAARQWFGEFNRGVMEHPRARVIVEDGRTWIAAHDGEFDVVVSDLFLPWGPGEGRLYSVEHFRACRRALRDGGMFCLWLPMYQLTDRQFDVILATFLEVFPVAELFLRDHAEDQPVIGIFGWKDGPGLDWRVPGERLAMERRAADNGPLADVGDIRDLHLGGVLRQDDARATRNTLDNLWVELDASRTRVARPETAPYLSGAQWREWLERWKSRAAEYN